MLKKLIGIAMATIWAGNAISNEAIDNFAYRAEISTAPEQLQKLRLPIDILLDITQQNIGDIAVFDANGKTLPHLVRKVVPSTVNKTTGLQYHVFDSYKNQHSKMVTTREQSEQDGQVSELRTTETISTHQIRHDFLIELPENPKITSLELVWQQQPENQLLQAKIEIGKTLDDLRVFDEQKTLSNLNPNKSEWRFIRNIPQGQKYLRITASDNIDVFQLLSVIGHFQEQQPEPKLWHPVELSKETIDNTQYLGFDSPSRAIIASDIQMFPGESHSSIQGNVYGSNESFEQKRRVISDFHQHNIEGENISANQPISLPKRHYQHWWISAKHRTEALPMVQMAYPVYELIFLGNGSQPYSLAWGNYENKSHSNNLAELMNDEFSLSENTAANVQLNEIQIAGGQTRLTLEPALPWKKWFLWVLLVFAAAITGRMAYKLYQDMNK